MSGALTVSLDWTGTGGWLARSARPEGPQPGTESSRRANMERGSPTRLPLPHLRISALRVRSAVLELRRLVARHPQASVLEEAGLGAAHAVWTLARTKTG